MCTFVCYVCVLHPYVSVSPRARSSMSSSSSSASSSESNTSCSRIMWQVEQAHSPPQAPSTSKSLSNATSSNVSPTAASQLTVLPSAITKLTVTLPVQIEIWRERDGSGCGVKRIIIQRVVHAPRGVWGCDAYLQHYSMPVAVEAHYRMPVLVQAPTPLVHTSLRHSVQLPTRHDILKTT